MWHFPLTTPLGSLIVKEEHLLTVKILKFRSEKWPFCVTFTPSPPPPLVHSLLHLTVTNFSTSTKLVVLYLVWNCFTLQKPRLRVTSSSRLNRNTCTSVEMLLFWTDLSVLNHCLHKKKGKDKNWSLLLKDQKRRNSKHRGLFMLLFVKL